jgi:hypothetical protein
MSLINLLAKGRPDNFQTPEWPVLSLLSHIPPSFDFQIGKKGILDPCCGEGQLVKSINTYFKTSIAFGQDVDQGVDFLNNNQTYDNVSCIITNPPYSIKDEFIARCYELKKPFALLMPLSALEGRKRQPLYQEHGMQLVLLPKRVNFKTPSGKGSGAHFATAWFTNGFGFPKDITYLGD